MTLEEFDAFTQTVLAALEDDDKDEWYCTPRGAAEAVLTKARNELFSRELAEQEERKLYLKLHAKYGNKFDIPTVPGG